MSENSTNQGSDLASTTEINTITRHILNLLEEIHCMIDLQNQIVTFNLNAYTLDTNNLIKKQYVLLHSLLDKRAEILEQIHQINFT